MSFNQKTVLETFNLQKVRLPDGLGVHTKLQDILTPLAESCPPLQRKMLHNLSIVSVQPFGKGMTEAQKLNIPHKPIKSIVIFQSK